ncbi:MAG TPA: cupin domain-containing protein [Segetibacter sp.]|jgi:mannose-6-phosphate isomerase-like protein (cupin superfamily)
MKNISEFITSGIIESYVLGLATAAEQAEVEKYADLYVDVRTAIDNFSNDLETEALLNAVPPDPLVKPLLMATLDFITRMENGEVPAYPPALHQHSDISDYAEWLNRPDMTLPVAPENIYARIIGFTPELTTAIVWIKDMAPQEVHHDEYEKFLIVEGSCTIDIAEENHYLVPGDFIAIPLHKHHKVTVTSNTFCKVILQRAAA